MSMQFDYRREPDHTKPKKDWIKRPKIQVRLYNGIKFTDLISLVDSGADDCMFTSATCADLGIDLKTGTLKQFKGIAKGVLVDSYLHPIEIQVYGFSERIPVVAAFSESLEGDGILGQSGFFEAHTIEFQKYRGKLQINLRP